MLICFVATDLVIGLGKVAKVTDVLGNMTSGHSRMLQIIGHTPCLGAEGLQQLQGESL